MTDSVRFTNGGNGTYFQCDKGWNDPPKSVFASSTAGSRKRIDPRKRVAHDLNSTGFQQQPMQQPHINAMTNQPNCIPNQPNYPDRYMPPHFNNLPSTAPNTPPPPNVGMIPHATSNPDLSTLYNNANVITQLPPTETHYSSMPMNLQGPPVQHQPTVTQQPMMNGGIPTQHFQPPHASVASPPPMVSTPPMPMNKAPSPQPMINVPPQNAYFLPPAQPTAMPPSNFGPPSTFGPPSNMNKPSVPPTTASYSGMPLLTKDGSQDGRKLSAPTNNLNSSIFDQLSTPTMLQSTHLAKKLGSMEISTTPVTNNTTSSPHLSPKLGHQEQARRSPTNLGAPLYPLQNQPNIGAPPGVVAAPPTNGFYNVTKLSNGSNSPKSISPYSSLQNTEVQTNQDKMLSNDSELLSEVIEQLTGVHNKCSCVMTSKIADEINKKVQVLKTSWTSGKLSNNVKLQMSSLVKALDSRDFNQADSIHKSLIVSNSAEVMSWMIGIKKLIISYQKVVEENNKY